MESVYFPIGFTEDILFGSPNGPRGIEGQILLF